MIDARYISLSANWWTFSQASQTKQLCSPDCCMQQTFVYTIPRRKQLATIETKWKYVAMQTWTNGFHYSFTQRRGVVDTF